MATVNATTLKGYFNAGDEPTESNFANLIDSFPLLHSDHTNHFSGSLTVTGSSGFNDSVRIYGAAKTLVCTGSVDFGTTGNHTALSLSGSLKISGSGINIQPEILTPAAEVTLSAAQSGKLLLIPSIDTSSGGKDIYKIPIPTFIGQTYNFAWSHIANDNDNIQFQAPTADDWTMTGGILYFDGDAGGASVVTMQFPGADDDKFLLSNPEGFNITFTATTLTNYHLSGWAMSQDTTNITFGDL